MLPFQPKPKPQSFQDFSRRFQLAQLLEQGNKGVIFIGNTRAGKTTLSCAAAGSTIKIKYHSKFELTFLQPSEQKFRALVKDTNQSVTEIPNFFKAHNLAIVDMPGYADSSRFRQLINFHYIKTMVTNLKEIRFFVVVTLSYGEGKYQIQGVEKRMLENFAQTFPQCRECVSIIINRVQHNTVGNRNSNQIEAIKGAFRILIGQNQIIRSYFAIVDNTKIHVLFRPKYNENIHQTDWEEEYPALTKQMRQLCLDQNARYLGIQNLNTHINIFKQGDNTQNQKFQVFLRNILEQQHRRGTEVIKCYQSIVFQLLKGFVGRNLPEKQDQIQQILDELLRKDIKVEREKDRLINIDPYNADYRMIQSRIIKLYFSLMEIDNLFSNFSSKNEKTEFIFSTINNAMGQLTWIIHYAYPDNKTLSKKMKSMHVYLIRRLEESFFIQKTLKNKKIYNTVPLQELIQQTIYQLPRQINKFQMFTNDIIQNFYELTDQFLSLNLKVKFNNGINQQTKKELLQTLGHIKILNDKGIIVKEQEKINKINQKVDKKINQVQIFFILIYAPPINKPEEIKTYIYQLLTCYTKTPSKQKQNKFRLASKIVTNIAKRQPKQAIPLFLHLQIFEQAIKIVDSLVVNDPKKVQPKKTEIVVKWYLQLAEFFKTKKKAHYFQRCIQKAKSLCIEDMNMFVQLQRVQQQGLQTISALPKRDTSVLKDPSINQKLQFWKWDQIDEQIEFLKHLYKPQNKKKEWKVIGAKLRQ